MTIATALAALHRIDMAAIRIGTAGWGIPRGVAQAFAGEGSHLERYARTLACAEINSTFYKLPRMSTLARWAMAVPEGFRFSVKVPKTMTHGGFAPTAEEFAGFLEVVSGLGERLGPLLFQLPPKQAFVAANAEAAFAVLRGRYAGPLALEPRHASWFTAAGDEVLRAFDVARVGADPARVPEAAGPIAASGLVYFRLHGSPRMYYSAYAMEHLERLKAEAGDDAASGREVWVIFDNTASGAAAANALELRGLLTGSTGASESCFPIAGHRIVPRSAVFPG
jgi:uncharacterized protein YecE (DUF72 family)